MRYLGPNHGTTLVSVPTPGDPSVVALLDGRVVALVTLTVRDGLIVEHEDSSITCAPSLVMPSGWHGYLERGVWRTA